MKKFILFLLFFTSSLFSNECKLDKTILYTILLNEGLSKNKGYEYIISFNNKNDTKRAKNSKLRPYFITSNTLDCKNPFLCEVVLTKLNEAGIKNLDLGAFQINYRSHRLNKKDYFDLEKSYQYACGYIQDNIKKYGYNWFAIASYHSQTPYYNMIYQKKLKQNYAKIVTKLNRVN